MNYSIGVTLTALELRARAATLKTAVAWRPWEPEEARLKAARERARAKIEKAVIEQAEAAKLDVP